MSIASNERQSKADRGEIRISWKSALVIAWISRGKSHLLKSLVVSGIAGIMRILQGFPLSGFVLWTSLALVMFAVHMSEDARLQRKASRFTSN